ncbi:hypothetical protein ACOME3_006197 [Neoechinorhynchus agilis]
MNIRYDSFSSFVKEVHAPEIDYSIPEIKRTYTLDPMEFTTPATSPHIQIPDSFSSTQTPMGNKRNEICECPISLPFQCTECKTLCCINCALSTHSSHHYVTLANDMTNHDDNGTHCSLLTEEYLKLMSEVNRLEESTKESIRKEFTLMATTLIGTFVDIEENVEKLAKTKRTMLLEMLRFSVNSMSSSSKKQIHQLLLHGSTKTRSGCGPKSSLVHADFCNVKIRSKVKAIIQVKDHFGCVVQSGGDVIDASVQLVSKEGKLDKRSNSVIDVIDNNNGTYLICLIFNRIGKHLLVVNINGQNLHGTPFVIDVKNQRKTQNIQNHRVLSPFNNNNNAASTSNGESSSGRKQNWSSIYARPWGICCHQDGYVFVADRCNHNVKMLNPNLKFLVSIGRIGIAAGEFNRPSGVACDNNLGRLLVCDKDNHRIQIFSMSDIFARLISMTALKKHDGVVLEPIVVFGCQGSGRGQFNYPWDIAVNENSQFVITDTKNLRLQLFDRNGLFISEYNERRSSKRKPFYPRGVAFTPNNHVVSTDFEKHQILVLDSSLKFLRIICGEGSSPGYLRRPQGVEVDTNGDIIVADSRNYRIQIFNQNGGLKHVFGKIGSGGCDQMDRPCGVCKSPLGYLLVVDFGNDRILKF